MAEGKEAGADRKGKTAAASGTRAMRRHYPAGIQLGYPVNNAPFNGNTQDPPALSGERVTKPVIAPATPKKK